MSSTKKSGFLQDIFVSMPTYFSEIFHLLSSSESRRCSHDCTKNCYAHWLCCSDQWFWLMKRNLFCVVTRSPCAIGCTLQWQDRFRWTTSIEVQQPELATRKNKVNRYEGKLISFWHEGRHIGQNTTMSQYFRLLHTRKHQRKSLALSEPHDAKLHSVSALHNNSRTGTWFSWDLTSDSATAMCLHSLILVRMWWK